MKWSTAIAIATPPVLYTLYQVYQRYLWSPKIIIGWRGYLPVHPYLKYRERPLESIEYITVHHFANDTWDAVRAAEHHISKKRPGISYWSVIELDGTLVICHPMTTESWHSGGKGAIINRNSLGIAFAGNCSNKLPNEEQLRTFDWTLRAIKRELPQFLKLSGHRDAKATKCPGAVLYNHLKGISLPKGIVRGSKLTE